MVSIVIAVFVSCLLVAKVTSGAYLVPAQVARISQSLPTEAVSPHSAMVSLCLDEQTISPECYRYTPLLRLMLSKLYRSLQNQARTNGVTLSDENIEQSRSPSKRTRDNLAGFYSNW